MIAILKLTTLVAWVAIVVNWISPFGGQIQEIFNWAGIFLAGAHFVEMLVFLPKARQAGGSQLLHAVQLLLFGYVHNMVLDAELKAAGT